MLLYICSAQFTHKILCCRERFGTFPGETYNMHVVGKIMAEKNTKLFILDTFITNKRTGIF